MIEAPNLDKVKTHKNSYPNSMGCILIAPKFHKKGFDEIIQRLEYLNHRSGENLHFYCAGYGAYWNSEFAPDMEELGISRMFNNDAIPWAFSQNYFAKFVDELENETNWTYSGGTEIIVLDKNLEFKNCIVFKIDEMISDKIIDNPNEIIEALIQQSKKGRSNTLISLQGIGNLAFDEAIKGFLGFLPKPIENIWNIWNKGKYYTLVDLK
ncbi:hypothetical protein QWZ06_02430 [Chryseobacterium tructae]|uniref:Uncharacterized protein n=1 Tax=Chryseobacterium tructae TaxID=1037380 RepID=A0ABV7XUV0_9FLAO|nr:hypothetical protein [Chryseobacterium tructae]MDN3691201.1 hypothetical protein [Chryseobacterium tructae]